MGQLNAGETVIFKSLTLSNLTSDGRKLAEVQGAAISREVGCFNIVKNSEGTIIGQILNESPKYVSGGVELCMAPSPGIPTSDLVTDIRFAAFSNGTWNALEDIETYSAIVGGPV